MYAKILEVDLSARFMIYEKQLGVYVYSGYSVDIQIHSFQQLEKIGNSKNDRRRLYPTCRWTRPPIDDDIE